VQKSQDARSPRVPPRRAVARPAAHHLDRLAERDADAELVVTSSVFRVPLIPSARAIRSFASFTRARLDGWVRLPSSTRTTVGTDTFASTASRMSSWGVHRMESSRAMCKH
jgi:hypothetical protein